MLRLFSLYPLRSDYVKGERFTRILLLLFHVRRRFCLFFRRTVFRAGSKFIIGRNLFFNRLKKFGVIFKKFPDIFFTLPQSLFPI